MLLRHSLGLFDEADCIERSVDGALNSHAFTADLATNGRSISTTEAANAVIEQMQAHCYVAELRD
jgi:3-isopropylmalate dehydrogenase